MLGLSRVMDDLEPSEVEVVAQGLLKLDAPVAEFICGKLEVLNLAAVDNVEFYRILIDIAAMKALNAEFDGAGFPWPRLGPESNQLILVVTHLPQKLGHVFMDCG